MQSCAHFRHRYVISVLGADDAVDLRRVLRDDSADDESLRRLIISAMEIKPKGHDFDVYADGAKVMRFMSVTGG